MHRLDPNPLGAEVEISSVPHPHAGGWLVQGGAVTVDHDIDTIRFHRHGWHSWGAAAWVPLDAPPVSPLRTLVGAQADDPVISTASEHMGRWVGAVERADGQGLVLGSLGFDSVVTARAGVMVGLGPPDTEWFVWVGDVDLGLDAYARTLGDRLGRRHAGVGPIWCSWYAYGRHITPELLRATLDDVQRLPFDVFQIDDGWQREVGDWTERDGFEGTMAPLASEIAAAGLVPGLWLAPFIVHERSEVFRRSPEWLVRDEAGRPVPAGENFGGIYFGLDVTNPDVADFVAESLRRVIGWGYRYLKLDFLFGGAIQGMRSLPVTGEEAYRRGVEAIRAVVGDDVTLLACGAPIVPSIGVFDAIRTGPDVAPLWVDATNERYLRDFSIPSARHAITATLGRMWLRDVITVDPDIVFVRSRYDLLSPKQRLLLGDLALIAGFVATSDPPAWLDEAEQRDIRRLLEANPTVHRAGRFRYRIDGRDVDFASALSTEPGSCGLCDLEEPAPPAASDGSLRA